MLHSSTPIPYGKNNYYYQMDTDEQNDPAYVQDCAIDSTRKAQQEEDLEDLYSQLAQKEHDLVLAAELGKALLEENNLLLEKQEDLNTEIQQVKEVSEQEKYELRRQLEQLQTQYDSRLLDLQDEVIYHKDEKASQNAVRRSSEIRRQEIIDELTEQNQRLTTQLKQASQTEIDLHSEVDKLREQVNSKNSTMHSRSQLLETLQEEVEILTTAKSELEKRLSTGLEERKSLTCSIEETNDNVHMLERRNRETEAQLRLKDSELKELREHNQQLSEQIESQKLKFSLDEPYHGSSSLMAELENELSMSVSNSATGFAIGNYNEIECDDDFEDDDGNMEVELPGMRPTFDQNIYYGVFTELLQLLAILKDDNLEDDDDGDNLGAITEDTIVDLITEIKQLVEAKISNSRKSKTDEISATLESELEQMRDELYKTYSQLEVLQTEISRQDKELRQKTIEVEAVTTKACLNTQVPDFEEHETHDLISHLFLAHEDLTEISEHDSVLQELELKHKDSLTKDRMIEQLQEERDKAQARIDASEREIEKTKMELKALDSQLLSTIQQKASLSHQLDEWQDDIHQLLDKRLISELSEQEKRYLKQQHQASGSSSPEEKKVRSSPRRFSLWSSSR